MDFPGTVFGMSREEATMERVTRATRRASAGTAAIASCEHGSRDPDRARRPLAHYDRLFRAVVVFLGWLVVTQVRDRRSRN